MGLLDKLKDTVGRITGEMPAVKPPPDVELGDSDTDDEPHPDEPRFDLAGFDPDDENAFFHAVLHMDSDGPGGGSDESRAGIMQRYGIRDRDHWLMVKESVYAALVQKHGSMNEVGQRELNWRSERSPTKQARATTVPPTTANVDPVEGIDLERWAALNAAIVGGSTAEDVIRGAGLDPARWERVNAEWNARMARDTTMAISAAYGNAFQAASQGKYADHVHDVIEARAENRDPSKSPPLSYDEFFEILYAQGFAAAAGQDPAAALQDKGLTIVDWTDLGTVMGYHLNRNGVRDRARIVESQQRAREKLQAQYPSVAAADLDLQL
ncbi:MAG TPA: hypothetical protein VFQ53_40455 [Kofleriaceae bacterium]|nr:hypothetical protein [Kofleriaceae bacterium]